MPFTPLLYLGDMVPVIFSSAIFFCTLYLLSAAISPACKYYRNLPYSRLKSSWNFKICSSVHAISIVILAIPALNLHFDDVIFGYDKYSAIIYSISIGYFIFDILYSLITFDGGHAMIAHGVISLLTYLFSLVSTSKD